LPDLLVAERVHLGQHERGALFVGQAPEVDDQVAEILPALDLRDKALGDRLGELADRLLAARAQHRVAAVARDREQPRAQVDRLLGGDEIVISGEEGLLDGVLGLLGAAEHVAAEGQDRPVVAVIDCLERHLLALADEVDEAGVAGKAKQTRRRDP
jgi:hypothetical protein